MSTPPVLWTEKYRPKTIDECILPERIKDTFQSLIEKQEIPNLLLHSPAGYGKTTIARALCRQLDLSLLFINGSKDSGIDMVRSTVNDFASSMSIDGGGKCVIFDEADYMNKNSTQPSLRGFIEQYANTRFIFTCNYPNRIIDPLKSRLTEIDLTIHKEELPKLITAFCKRVVYILKNEKVEIKCKKKHIVEFVTMHAPDWRKCLTELYSHSRKGFIDKSILKVENIYDGLIECLSNKDFDGCVNWVNTNNIPKDIYHSLFVYLCDKTENKAELSILANEYDYKMSFNVSEELNLIAFLSECFEFEFEV